MNPLPPFGKSLLARQSYKNPPFLVVVCIGSGAWANAKQWSKNTEVAPLVLGPGASPESLTWPVNDCMCLVDRDIGPDDNLVVRLIRTLIKSGAKSVIVRPLYVDSASCPWKYDETNPPGQRWRQIRDKLQVYFPPEKGVSNAA